MTTDKKDRIPNAPDKGLIPKLRFPEFKEGWKSATIGLCCSPLEYGMNAAATEYDGANKYIRITDIDENTSRYKYDDIVSPSGELEDRYKVRPNDILFARTGASTGKTYLYNDNDGTLYFAGFLIRGNIKPHFNSRFVFYQTQLKRYWKWVAIMSARSGQPGINSQEYESYELFLPSRTEQDKIADLLELIDQRISTQSRAIEDLKRLRLAIQDKLIEQLVCSNDLKSFSEVYEVAGEGGTPDTSKREYYEGGTIPFIKIDDLANKYLKEHKDSITELGMCKSSAWLVPANSLIFSNGATIGSASINSYPVATKQGVLGIVPKNNISVEYLYYLMTSTYFKKQVHRIITHGTMATAYLRDINKIAVPIPNIDKQKYVSLVLSSLSRKEDIEIQMLCRLQNQKQYLLQRMFI